MASSPGSNIFAVTAVLTIALLVLLVIRHFLPLRTTPTYLLLPVFLALALPCSIIVLVPIDLASADTNESKHALWLPERVILVTWRITYWLTFLLSWFVLPLLGEYCDSGFRDPRSRTIDSLRTNARYQLMVLSTAVLGLVYFIWENGFHVASIKGLVMALAYAWGLTLAIGLMGHGLVALPRRLFMNADVSTRLRRLQTQAPKIKERLDEATEKLELLESTVLQLKRHKGGASREQQDWIDELAETSTLPDTRPGYAAAAQASNPAIPSVVTDRYLADLTRKLKRARHRKARFDDEWTNLCQQAQDTQTILDSATSRSLDFGRTRDTWIGRLNFLTPMMRYHLHMNVVPALRKALSGILAIGSVLIVWSEIVKSFAPQLSVIGLTVVHHSGSKAKINFGGQLMAALWLLYMDTSALYAISDVKVWGNRALVKRQTYAESACWYSLQVAKLTVPLSYNFITMMPPAVFKETMFFRFLGSLINLTPLGQGFSAFFPIVLLVPVIATLFNLYGKAKGVFGFGMLEDESDENPTGFGTGGWREGRALIEREVQARGNEGTLGLASRGASLDLERGVSRNSATSNPSRRTPRDESSIYRDEHVREANRQFNSITNHEEGEDDSARHFYQDFGERVKNTIDSSEVLRNLGSAFTAPRWMQNDQGSGGSAISRLFGGRAEGGRVRL